MKIIVGVLLAIVLIGIGITLMTPIGPVIADIFSGFTGTDKDAVITATKSAWPWLILVGFGVAAATIVISRGK